MRRLWASISTALLLWPPVSSRAEGTATASASETLLSQPQRQERPRAQAAARTDFDDLLISGALLGLGLASGAGGTALWAESLRGNGGVGYEAGAAVLLTAGGLMIVIGLVGTTEGLKQRALDRPVYRPVTQAQTQLTDSGMSFLVRF